MKFVKEGELKPMQTFEVIGSSIYPVYTKISDKPYNMETYLSDFLNLKLYE